MSEDRKSSKAIPGLYQHWGGELYWASHIAQSSDLSAGDVPQVFYYSLRHRHWFYRREEEFFGMAAGVTRFRLVEHPGMIERIGNGS